LAFERIRGILKDEGTVYFEGAVLDHAYNVDRYWQGKSAMLGQLATLPIAYFTAGEYAADTTNWFIPTQACLREWLSGTGFKDVTVLDPPNVKFSRAAGSAKKDPTYSRPEDNLL
jgi:hypothetical protein